MQVIKVTFILIMGISLIDAEVVRMNDDGGCPVKSHIGPYSYNPVDSNGPESWGFINPEYATCVTGQYQSPIDFPLEVQHALRRDGPQLMLSQSAEMEFLPRSYNWMWRCRKEGSCGGTMFQGKMFYVVLVEFHKPSEHFLNGTQYPLEVYILHRSTDNQVAIIAALFTFDDHSYSNRISEEAAFENGVNPAIGVLFDAVKAGNSTVTANLAALIHKGEGFCAYMGSLTVPPCTEGVMFFISLHIGTVSRRQVHTYWTTTGFSFNGNNRPLKPLHGRNISCFLKDFVHNGIEVPV